MTAGILWLFFRLCGHIGTFGRSRTPSLISTPEASPSTPASGLKAQFAWRRLVPLIDDNLFVIVRLFQLSYESYLVNRRNLLVFTGQVPLLDAEGSKCFSILLLWVRLLRFGLVPIKFASFPGEINPRDPVPLFSGYCPVDGCLRVDEGLEADRLCRQLRVEHFFLFRTYVLRSFYLCFIVLNRRRNEKEVDHCQTCHLSWPSPNQGITACSCNVSIVSSNLFQVSTQARSSSICLFITLVR